MKLYYKGKVEEVSGNETKGRGMVRMDLRFGADGRSWLLETHFQKHVEHGEVMLRWHHTTRKDWDKMVAEAQRRDLEWLWRH